MQPDIKAALADRHNVMVVYDEPWPGRTADGNEITENMQCRCTVHAAVNIRRWSKMPIGLALTSDAQLLSDFITANYAWLEWPGKKES